MYKRIVMIFLLFIISALCAVNAGAQTIMLEYDGGVHEYNDILCQLQINHKTIYTPLEPILFNNRALVPLREVFENVGADVAYDVAEQRVDVSMNGQKITVNIDSPTAYINGKATTIPDDVTPKLIAKVGENPKTMVPVRFVAENIGADVTYDNGVIGINTVKPQCTITNVSYKMNSATQCVVTITANGDISKYHDFTLTAPERVVVDIPNASYSTANNIAVNQGAVSSIRLGDDGERTRVVIDTQSIKSHTANLSAGKNQLTITLNTNSPITQTPAPSPKPTPTPAPSAPNVNASSKLVVIDAGHGGSDGGASGTYGGNAIYEKNLTLAIAKKVQSILLEKGCTVVMTRDGDTYPELYDRSELANEKNAAIFVSVHINSVDGASSAHGTEVYYSTQNNGDSYGATSENLAENILKEMISLTGARNRGVKTANHVVTRTSNMPAALVEVGFISNEEELGKMLDETYQWSAAQGIANGIMKTLSNIIVK